MTKMIKDGTLLSMKTRVGSDNFQTPAWPVEALVNFINSDLVSQSTLPKDADILDPCCGKGNILITLISLGYLNVGGLDKETGFDFLTDPLPADTDVIITNPPYSIKDDFIAKCYEYKKPFALLMPLTALEGKKRLALYKEHGMQLCLLPRRVNFETPSGIGKGAWFPVGWFTHGFKLPRDINYL